MAVEIRELVIKAVITDDNTNNGHTDSLTAFQNQQQLVQECVSQVLKIIKQNQNR